MTKIWIYLLVFYIGQIVAKSDSTYYVGCFHEISNSFLEEFIRFNDTKGIYTECNFYCKEYQYLAIQEDDQCYCLNKIPIGWRDSICDPQCPNFGTKTCGSNGTSSVYRVKRSETTVATTTATTSVKELPTAALTTAIPSPKQSMTSIKEPITSTSEKEPTAQTTTTTTITTLSTTQEQKTTINSTGFDFHIGNFLIPILLGVIICVLLVQAFILCSLRKQHRQLHLRPSVAVKYVKDEKRPQQRTGHGREQKHVQKTAAKDRKYEYESIEDNLNVNIPLHHSRNVGNEGLNIMAEVGVGLVNDYLTPIHVKDQTTPKLVEDQSTYSKSHYDIVNEDTKLDNVVKGNKYVDMRGTVPRF